MRCSGRRSALALERDLPIVIHTREAEDDTLRILIREEGRGASAACSTASPVMQRRGACAGHGLLHFDSRRRHVPESRIAAPGGGRSCRPIGCWSKPTAPYLAPVPLRGKRNEPAYVARVVEQLAAVAATSAAALGELTDRNFDRLFRP